MCDFDRVLQATASTIVFFAIVAPLRYIRSRDTNRFQGLAYHETDNGTGGAVRHRWLGASARRVQPGRNRRPQRRIAEDFRYASRGGLARKGRRRCSHGLRRTYLQRGVRPPGAPSAPARAGHATSRRTGIYAPVQDQREGRLQRRRLAVAPGLRHLGATTECPRPGQ